MNELVHRKLPNRGMAHRRQSKNLLSLISPVTSKPVSRTHPFPSLAGGCFTYTISLSLSLSKQYKSEQNYVYSIYKNKREVNENPTIFENL